MIMICSIRGGPSPAAFPDVEGPVRSTLGLSALRGKQAMIELVDHLFSDGTLGRITFAAATDAILKYISNAVVHAIHAIVDVVPKRPCRMLVLRGWRVAIKTICGCDLLKLLASQIERNLTPPCLEPIARHGCVERCFAWEQSSLWEGECIEPFPIKAPAGLRCIRSKLHKPHRLYSSAFALANKNACPK